MEIGAEFDLSECESAYLKVQHKGMSKKKKKKKINDCKCNRLILHQGYSGTYLSQQGEPSEG